MAFEENNPSSWSPENDGDSITGILIKIQDDVGANKSKLYTVEVDGKPTNIWGSVILDQRMIGINIGDRIRVTYKGLGEKQVGKNPPKIFKVEVDKDYSKE